MNVVELRVGNFAAIKAAVIRPDGSGLVQITGRNDQGKSTILLALKAAMQGKRGAPMRALRDGTQEGFLEADCGRLKVLRTITRKGDAEEWTLKITLDGKAVGKGAQAVIDGFLGALGFDPLQFARWSEDAEGRRRQADTLKRFASDFDFAGNKAARDEVFSHRTEIGRDRDRSRAAAESVVLPPGPKPAAIDVAARMAELQAANAANEAIATRALRRQEAASQVDAKRDEAEVLRARAATLEAEAEALQAKLDAAEPIPDPVDTAPMAAAITAADATNRARALHEARTAHEAAFDEAAERYKRMTAEIAALDAARVAAVKGAKLPVDGLSLDPELDVVVFNGKPFENAAFSQKIRVSTAIAMAMNPELRVVLIDQGSELDREALAAIGEMAREREYDVWLTRVDESREVGFVIEEGEVVSP